MKAQRKVQNSCTPKTSRHPAANPSKNDLGSRVQSGLQSQALKGSAAGPWSSDRKWDARASELPADTPPAMALMQLNPWQLHHSIQHIKSIYLIVCRHMLYNYNELFNEIMELWIGLQIDCNNLLNPPPEEPNSTNFNDTGSPQQGLAIDPAKWPATISLATGHAIWYHMSLWEKWVQPHSLPQQHSWYGMGCDCPSNYHKCGIST